MIKQNGAIGEGIEIMGVGDIIRLKNSMIRFIELCITDE